MALRWTTPDAGKRLPFARFLPLLRSAVEAAPERVDLRLQLARTLFHDDRIAELVERLKPILKDDRAAPELLYYLGCGAAAAGDDQLARMALERAAGDGFAPAHGYLADALLRLGRPDEALAAGLRGLEESLTDFKALGIVARTLLMRGEAGRLWDVTSGLRRRGAWGAYIPSAMAHAAATPEQRAEVAALVDTGRWFSAVQPTGPGDPRNGLSGDFNARLRAELLAHKSLTVLPSIKATAGAGNRINQLQIEAGPLARDLLLRIRAAIETYVAERQVGADHPMIGRRPDAVSLDCWAVTVRQDGHEEWHIHPTGWISGVYYVAVPNVAGSDGCRGAIEFGPLPFGTEADRPSWPRWRVMPRAGQLLLFPSYYAHRTWPTGVDEPRVCVAFDVVSAAAPKEAH